MSGEFIIFVGNFKTMKTMKKYICTVCSYIYDPAVGDPDGRIAHGTASADIPQDWVCKLCRLAKEDFEPVEE